MTFIEHLLSTRISQYFHLTSESQYPLLENMVFNSCATILPEWGWNPKMLCLMNFDPKRVLQVVVVGGAWWAQLSIIIAHAIMKYLWFLISLLSMGSYQKSDVASFHLYFVCKASTKFMPKYM